MIEKENNKVKIPWYKKVIVVGILIAVTIYCIPELQEKLICGFDFLKSEWRKTR